MSNTPTPPGAEAGGSSSGTRDHGDIDGHSLDDAAHEGQPLLGAEPEVGLRSTCPEGAGGACSRPSAGAPGLEQRQDSPTTDHELAPLLVHPVDEVGRHAEASSSTQLRGDLLFDLPGTSTIETRVPTDSTDPSGKGLGLDAGSKADCSKQESGG